MNKEKNVLWNDTLRSSCHFLFNQQSEIDWNPHELGNYRVG